MAASAVTGTFVLTDCSTLVAPLGSKSGVDHDRQILRCFYRDAHSFFSRYEDFARGCGAVQCGYEKNILIILLIIIIIIIIIMIISISAASHQHLMVLSHLVSSAYHLVSITVASHQHPISISSFHQFVTS